MTNCDFVVHGRACQMPGTMTQGTRRVCPWHHDCLQWPELIDDRTTFAKRFPWWSLLDAVRRADECWQRVQGLWPTDEPFVIVRDEGWNPHDVAQLKGLIAQGSKSLAWTMAPDTMKQAAIAYYKQQGGTT